MHQKKEKKLGLWMLTALVTGNMIGSGIFLLPATLAKLGTITLFSWCATILGTFFLALMFSQLSTHIPKTGGPYAYVKAGLGRFMGFQTAYIYWFALLIGNAAVVVTFVSYFRIFIPALSNPYYAVGLELALIWILTIVNMIGIRTAGSIQLITTVLKIIPILLIGIFGWFFIHPEYFTDYYNISSESNTSALTTGAALTLWAFIGVESATIPAGAVDNPRKTIPLATLLGTTIAAIVYLSSSAAIMGMIPAAVLQYSTAPFAAAASIILGHWGAVLIGVGALISTAGTLNGWILLQGQMPMAAADDGLFPKIFSKRNSKNLPAYGLAISSVVMSCLLLLTISDTLIEQFEKAILLAVVGALLPYAYTAIANLILMRDYLDNKKQATVQFIIAICACLYSIWLIIFGVGLNNMFYAAIVLLTSIPVYYLFSRKKA